MNFIYNFLKNILGFIQFIFAMMSPLMIVFWAFKFIKLPFVPKIEPFFEAMNVLGRAFFDNAIQFHSDMIDVSYIASSVGFLILYGIFSYIQRMIESRQFQHNVKLKKQEYSINLREEQRVMEQITLEIRKYSKFMIMLDLELTHIVNKILVDVQNADLEVIKKECYDGVIDIMKAYNADNMGILENKLYIVGAEFEEVDRFVLKLVAHLKKVSGENSARGIKTDFVILIDAMKASDEVLSKANELERLSRTKYRNEFLATSEFVMRYDLREVKKLRFDVRAVHRVYTDDNLENYREFELYKVRSDRG